MNQPPAGQNEPVVHAALDAADGRERRAARAAVRASGGDVAQPVADEWHGEGMQAGHHHLASLSRGHGPAVPHDLDDRAVVARVEIPGRRTLPGDEVEFHASVPFVHGRRNPSVICRRISGVATSPPTTTKRGRIVRRSFESRQPATRASGAAIPVTTSGWSRRSSSMMAAGSRRLWITSTRRSPRRCRTRGTQRPVPVDLTTATRAVRSVTLYPSCWIARSRRLLSSHSSKRVRRTMVGSPVDPVVRWTTRRCGSRPCARRLAGAAWRSRLVVMGMAARSAALRMSPGARPCRFSNWR